MKTFKEMLSQICEGAGRFVAKLSHLKPNFGHAEGDAVALGGVIAEQPGGHIHWAEVMMGFCFASAIQIATLWSQLHSNFAPNFDILSITILLSFASIFVSKYIAAKFRRPALVLEQLGVLFAVTGFFIAIAISFSKTLVITAWVVYGVCLMVIIVCNCFF